MVHIHGLLGPLPKSEDLRATLGEHYDVLSAFQSYFLYDSGLY